MVLPEQKTLAQAVRAGSGPAKSGFLAPMLRGEKVPAIAVTEPHCGTDAVAMRAKAVRKGERYFLSGEKSGITLAKEAAMVKWMGPRFSVDAIRDCLLLHGHYGYTQEYRFEQRLRY